MKTKTYRIRMQIPLVSLAPAFERLNPQRLTQIIHNSADNRAQARQAAKPQTLNLIQA